MFITVLFGTTNTSGKFKKIKLRPSVNFAQGIIQYTCYLLRNTIFSLILRPPKTNY